MDLNIGSVVILPRQARNVLHGGHRDPLSLGLRWSALATLECPPTDGPPGIYMKGVQPRQGLGGFNPYLCSRLTMPGCLLLSCSILLGSIGKERDRSMLSDRRAIMVSNSIAEKGEGLDFFLFSTTCI